MQCYKRTRAQAGEEGTFEIFVNLLNDFRLIGVILEKLKKYKIKLLAEKF